MLPSLKAVINPYPAPRPHPYAPTIWRTTTTLAATNSVSGILAGIFTSALRNGACAPTRYCPASLAQGLTLQTYANDYLTGYGKIDGAKTADYYLLQGLQPTGQTLTNSTEIPFFYATTPGQTRTLDGLAVDANNFSAAFTGYYRPAMSGTYTFCALGDDVSTFYFGHLSTSGITCGRTTVAAGATPVIGDQYYDSVGLESAVPDCHSADLVAGLLYPFRLVYGQIVGGSLLNFTITSPDGVATMDQSGLVYPLDTACLL